MENFSLANTYEMKGVMSGLEEPRTPKLKKLFFLMLEVVMILMMPPLPCAL